ncbi:uncharacterized protein LOC126618650 isoform X1 [Malus sylvestris]|uniref:uncharacterized protein LOC126618650 isoform X1 n=1 Tax=Malus sylvestris TaxID=3752 RepID=UPI0021AC2F7B|nr:uncharacterized protein LOC126618650 isoform X1 [Malus sylvestris]
MSSSRRVYKQFEEQHKRLLAQQEELVNLEECGGGDKAFAMEEDEDDDHRRLMASHSRRVMEAVGQKPNPDMLQTSREKGKDEVFFLSKKLRLPYECLHMEHLQIKWMRSR